MPRTPRSLSMREVRAALPRLEEVLREVGEITVTRHGQPVARLLSIRTRRAKPTHAELRASMKRLRQPSERLVREDRDAR